MVEESKYCALCEQLLIPRIWPFKKGMKVYHFKDGAYCEPCAKIKVEEMRKKKNAK